MAHNVELRELEWYDDTTKPFGIKVDLFVLPPGDPTTATLTVQQIESETVIASPHGVWGAMGTMAGGETEAKDHF